MLNVDKDMKTKETAAKKVMEATDRKQRRRQKKQVNRTNLFLVSKGISKTMISTRFSIWRMIACVNTSVIIFKGRLLI